MRFPRHYRITKGELNIAPLVDVILQQLIYFMLTSSFIMQPGIKIKLPQAATAETVQAREIFVDISADGVLFYRGRAVTVDLLGMVFDREAGRNPGVMLVIKGDERSRHGDVVKVMDRARRAGIEKIAIATMPEME